MKVIIFANGRFTDHHSARAEIGPADIVIAADGGARHCQAIELIPQVLIGDYDSLSQSELDSFQNAGTKLIRYPAKKDWTDLELAIEYACQLKPKEILIYGGLGNRWDQTLANLLLLSRVNCNNTRLRMLDGPQEISLVRGPQTLNIQGEPGDTVSLIPIAGHAQGVKTQGLEYPLNDEPLYFGATRGVSNVLVENTASISLSEGMLVCILIHKSTKENL